MRRPFPFDYTGEFSPHGELCPCEVFAERFLSLDIATAQVGEIVHVVGAKEAKYDPAEASEIGRMIEGLRALHADDVTLVEQRDQRVRCPRSSLSILKTSPLPFP